MKTTRFLGKNVLITGGSSGIGLETAIEFGKLGAHLFLMARNVERLQDAVKQIQKKLGEHTRVVPIVADVSIKEQVEAGVHKVAREHGGIHTLIANAGILSTGLMENMDKNTMEHIMAVNYFGAVYATQAAWPYLKLSQNGHIGFVSSVAGYVGIIGYGAYCATKFAMAGFAESLRMEAQPYNIGVTVVFPPDTDTPMLEEEHKHAIPEALALSKHASVLSPQQVAKKFVKGIIAHRFEVFCNLESRFIRICRALCPSVYFHIIDYLVERERRKGKR
jgi:3-dehydrosphinganine reductase